MASKKPREIALQALLGQGQEDYIEVVLDKTLANSALTQPDRRLCQELTYGVVRWQETLDWIIARKTRSRPRTEQLRAIIRLGLYQLLWLDRIPDHAAIFETVELARQHGLRAQSAFVNGLLRSCQRERESLRRQLGALKTSDPHLGYSHPDWLVKKWTGRWGAASARQLLEWNNQPPPTYARLNTLKATRSVLTGAWGKEGVEYTAANFEWAPEGSLFELKRHPPLAELGSFREGMFYVQDPSTLLPVKILGAQPGESVLDLCAAPGGKLTYIAQQMRGQAQGRLCASDLNESRFKLIKENCARLGVTCVAPSPGGEGRGEGERFSVVDGPCVELIAAAALNRQAARGGASRTKDLLSPALSSSEPDWPSGGEGEATSTASAQAALRFSVPAFDRVLVDAPCSNTGVMRRRVDLRWRIRPEEISRLQDAQLRLLRTALSLLKPNGTLVYSTCSLELEENQDVVNLFLKSEPGTRLEEERELWPFRDGVDGAYVARIVSGAER